MNLSVEATSEIVAPPRPRYAMSDWLVLLLVAGGFVASWTCVITHWSVEAFGICMGGQGTFIAAFHWMSVLDDKRPDAKD